MFSHLDRAFTDPVLYVTVVFAVLLSIVLHELGHALTATWEGDPTPKIRGHLTWNPVVHMGWMSIVLVLVMGLGWGATPVTPRFFRHRRWGDALVSFSGPAVNIALAFLGAVVTILIARSGTAVNAEVARFWIVLTTFNVMLFLLNMIPLPPLDGFGVLEGIFDLGEFGARLKGLGFFPLLVAILIVNSDPFGVVIAGGIELVFSAAALVVGRG